jgi:hypothetical protein
VVPPHRGTSGGAVLKEEKELRKWANEYLHIYGARRKLLLKDITAFRRAVIEECAKVAGGYDFENTHESVRLQADIAAAIRNMK